MLLAQASNEHLRLRSAWNPMGLPNTSKVDKDRKRTISRSFGQKKIIPTLVRTVQELFTDWIELASLI